MTRGCTAHRRCKCAVAARVRRSSGGRRSVAERARCAFTYMYRYRYRVRGETFFADASVPAYSLAARELGRSSTSRGEPGRPGTSSLGRHGRVELVEVCALASEAARVVHPALEIDAAGDAQLDARPRRSARRARARGRRPAPARCRARSAAAAAAAPRAAGASTDSRRRNSYFDILKILSSLARWLAIALIALSNASLSCRAETPTFFTPGRDRVRRPEQPREQ